MTLSIMGARPSTVRRAMPSLILRRAVCRSHILFVQRRLSSQNSRPVDQISTMPQLVSATTGTVRLCMWSQKARLARLKQSRLAARRAIAEGTRRFDEWQRHCGLAKGGNTAAAASNDRLNAAVAANRSGADVDVQPIGKKDLFELQHFHLLRCLEHTTVTTRDFSRPNEHRLTFRFRNFLVFSKPILKWIFVCTRCHLLWQTVFFVHREVALL